MREKGGGGERAWYTLFKHALNVNVSIREICGYDVGRIMAGCNDIYVARTTR